MRSASISTKKRLSRFAKATNVIGARSAEIQTLRSPGRLGARSDFTQLTREDIFGQKELKCGSYFLPEFSPERGDLGNRDSRLAFLTKVVPGNWGNCKCYKGEECRHNQRVRLMRIGMI